MFQAVTIALGDLGIVFTPFRQAYPVDLLFDIDIIGIC
jgi:hypothetical protein